MRVAVVTDILFFHRTGGLQHQVSETVRALQALGVEAEIVGADGRNIADFDLVHLFDIGHGNEAVVFFCKHYFRKPLVISPVISPFSPLPTRLLDRVGMAALRQLSRGRARTTFERTCAALASAEAVVALSEIERRVLIDKFAVDGDRIVSIPNGISDRFFRAQPDAFLERYAIRQPFVLCVGRIDRNKNQIALARALRDSDIDLAFIGPTTTKSAALVEELETVRPCHLLGEMDYAAPLLPSAYAAASVFVLPSRSEVTPMTVYEALAAGTPVVVTKNTALDRPLDPSHMLEVDPMDDEAIRQAIDRFLRDGGDRQARRDYVANRTWSNVASALRGVYSRVLDGPG